MDALTSRLGEYVCEVADHTGLNVYHVQNCLSPDGTAGVGYLVLSATLAVLIGIAAVVASSIRNRGRMLQK